MTENFQLFNLATMSGVFPGTRTLVYQRVRLQDDNAAGAQWGRILWYTDPPACVVEVEERGRAEAEPAPGNSGGARALVRLEEPLRGDFGAILDHSLAAAGRRLQACGTCTYWQRLHATTADGLPLGRCTWTAAPPPGAAAQVGLPGELAAQSLLALPCSRWQPAQGEREEPAAVELAQVSPMPKRAELESDERWTLWGRLRRRWGRKPTEAAAPASPQAAGQAWTAQVVERSGVGAGTEPCFACQGRIANLGALAVATPEGDKQTFSVWRCRACFTYYLNDWIDRWERTDSLETEESYYRLAPQEALDLLAVFDHVVDAEHPARRHERGAERAWVLAFVAGRTQLSHQIRQGR